MIEDGFQGHVGLNLCPGMGQLLQKRLLLIQRHDLYRARKKLKAPGIAVQRVMQDAHTVAVLQKICWQPLLPGQLQVVVVAEVFERPVVGLRPTRKRPAGCEQQGKFGAAQLLRGLNPCAGVFVDQFQRRRILYGFKVVEQQHDFFVSLPEV
jgi:hypothetical protein